MSLEIRTRLIKLPKVKIVINDRAVFLVHAHQCENCQHCRVQLLSTLVLIVTRTFGEAMEFTAQYKEHHSAFPLS